MESYFIAPFNTYPIAEPLANSLWDSETPPGSPTLTVAISSRMLCCPILLIAGLIAGLMLGGRQG